MKKIIAVPIIAVIGVIAAYYASPLFVNAVVDESLPDIMERNQPKTMWTGMFVGVGDGIHNAEGIAKVLTVNDGQTVHRILRLENFRATNGPDLHVYLSKNPTDISAGFIDLGNLKGNIGNQNYHIAEDVNVEEYSNVLIWCKQFSVLFGHAGLTAA